MIRANMHIGTCGWSYEHWNKLFYPEGLPPANRLAWYARRFRSVEVDSTFYHLPTEKSLQSWSDNVPADFRFAVKASRHITHMKKLSDPGPALSQLMGRLELLGDKLGPVLFQLPPHWALNLDRLTAFLKALPQDFRYAMEFRDPSWFDPRVYELLSEYAVALCIYDLDGQVSPLQVTTNLVYVRLHGPDGPYHGEYSGHALQGWSDMLKRWRREARKVYCYFDNDESGHAVQDALRLQEMVSRREMAWREPGKLLRLQRFSWIPAAADSPAPPAQLR